MNDLKWGMVSDVHFPRHDPRKVELFLKVMKWWQPTSIDLLGDIDDADSTSRWVEGTGRSFELVDEGVKLTREFMQDLSKICPKAEDKHFHDGNHGWYRHKRYLEKNAAPFLSLINAETLYEPSKYGFKFHDYDDKPIKRFGNMYAHHGESVSRHSGESVKADCQKYMVSLVRGHSHRQGAHFVTHELPGIIVEGYEVGHLCDEDKMTYEAVKNWQAGFAIAYVVKDEPFVQLIQIKETSHGLTCFVDGKRFDA